jgi:iron complex outermembrane receptor protein
MLMAMCPPSAWPAKKQVQGREKIMTTLEVKSRSAVMRSRRTARRLLSTTAACLWAGGLASAAHAQSTVPHAQSTIVDDVVVTARRQSESAQTAPVSVTVLSSATLAEHNIRQLRDVQTLVPGVVLAGVGGDQNAAYSIRGQGRDIVGPGLPSVLVYFNEVPLPAWGSNAATFDVSNVQVLKGPQGTLFGRNTTGGAILVYSKAPSYDLNGYGQVTVGDYSWNSYEGAVNVPIIKNVLAVRVAGDVERRHGYTKNFGVGGDGDDVHSNAYRVSVLFEPTSWFRNVTVYDDFLQNQHGNGVVPFGLTVAQPWKSSPFLTSAFGCGTSPACDIPLLVKQIMARGPHTMDSDVPSQDKVRVWGISNTTTIDMGAVTFKNIFGYRNTHQFEIGNTDGVPLALINTDFTHNEQQYTDEVQAAGRLLDNKLQWLLGGFLLEDKPSGSKYLDQDVLRPPSLTPAQWAALGGPEVQGDNLYTDRSRAIFGNLIYDLSGLSETLDGLKINAGLRYTWDRRGGCSQNLAITATPFSGLAACEASPGSSIGSVSSKKLSYTFGLDYKVSEELFLYATTRRGYRAGAVNTPHFVGLLAPYQTFGPQTVTDVEIGAHTRYEFGPVRTRFNIAAYQGKYDGLQRQITGIIVGTFGTTAATVPSNTSLTVNSGKATIKGFELDGSVGVGGFTLTFQAAYLDPKYDSITVPALFSTLQPASATFDNSPKWSYGFGGRYDLPLSKDYGTVSLAANLYHLDKFVNSAYTVPGYSRTDASLDWNNVMSKPISVSVFVNNVFDKVYYRNGNLVSNSLGLYDGGWGPPRMYGVRLRYEFGS